VKDLLDSAIGQNSLYTWAIEEGVINVFPKGRREPFLKRLLETNVALLRIAPGTSRVDFRRAVTDSPEVKSELAMFRVESDNQIYTSHDIRPLGPEYSLNAAGLTVRSILNGMIRESATKFWIVNLDGKEKQYLLLNL
jgi:hypothetical protein